MTAVGPTGHSLGRSVVRGRFAPSPTGPLHFGSLIAALGSFLDARHQDGEWWVRIEDLDPPRVVPGAALHILHTLEAHGLCWDGAVVYQSQRCAHYQAALEQLQQRGLAYPCTCSRKDLGRIARPGPAGFVYPGLCRNGVRHPGRPVAIRLRTDDGYLGFHDAIQGDYGQYLEREIGDFVIRRADGLFAYQLAVVIDDAAQGITQIVRGSDLLDSTPRQILLQRLLDLPTPAYAHLPVAVDRRGCKLSKQTRAPPLDSRRSGPTLVAALQFLGQAPPLDLALEPPAVILDWACTHWQRTQVPKILTRTWSFPIVSIATWDGLTKNNKAID
ncbi:MAG: tRNA glutamyl-Q(34) synthetase GluQRS [Candidatus Competibacteraceae bacterium]